MMDEKNEDVIMPGFRFHPTDEELVGFYLKRKIQQKPFPIELIKQLDIYNYEPWDLPKLAASGEKEWYFYCPRDRKYRNSARPNRVTLAGFWKATGTDRPIYTSNGSKCVGLKKSLVFYRGRAAKGIKTDWMMHEFRLPSLSGSAAQQRPLDKVIPPDDAWAICRIFKKNTKSMCRSWISSPIPEPITPDVQQQACFFPFSNGDVSSDYIFSQCDMSGAAMKCRDDSDAPSVVLNSALISETEQFSEFSISLVQENNEWGANGSIEVPFSLTDLAWDSESPSCPSEMSPEAVPVYGI